MSHTEITEDGVEFTYDSNGNIIHSKHPDGYESWTEYDANGNRLHWWNSAGHEAWYDYDDKGNNIHVRNSFGEMWFDSNGNEIAKEEFDKLNAA